MKRKLQGGRRDSFACPSQQGRCEIITFPGAPSFRPAWIGGLEKIWSGTPKIELHCLNPAIDSVLLNAKVTPNI